MTRKSHGKTTGGGPLNRRKSMQKAAAAAASTTALPTIVPASALGADGQVPPSNRITVAQIGLGVMGGGHLRRFTSDPSVEMLAVCDVDRTRLTSAQASVARAHADKKPRCAAYDDYQELLARDDIDAVVIVTPDHWHNERVW